MADTVPMQMCPMAETCKGLMEKRMSSFALMIPGLLLIGLGVVVLIEPRILVWLVALGLVVMGIAMLMMARFMRAIGKRFHQGG